MYIVHTDISKREQGKDSPCPTQFHSTKSYGKDNKRFRLLFEWNKIGK